MGNTFANRRRMTTATTGTGTITLGSAVSPYKAFADAPAVANGAVVSYAIEDGDDWEVGTGTYTSSGTTLSRTLDESSTGSLLNLTGNAEVFITVRAEDIEEIRTQAFIVAASDETTDLTTGTAKVTFRMPYAFTLTEVRASVTTAPTGAALTVDINEDGTTILSTKITIDATEKTSETAATAPVISDSALADDAEITVDIDQIGSTVAGAGLKVYLIGYKA